MRTADWIVDLGRAQGITAVKLSLKGPLRRSSTSHLTDQGLPFWPDVRPHAR